MSYFDVHILFFILIFVVAGRHGYERKKSKSDTQIGAEQWVWEEEK